MTSDNLLKESHELEAELLENRHWLHAHAETGFALTQTKAFVQKKLEEMGYNPVSCGKSGLIVTVGKNSDNGKVFLLRADMDALPVKEESNVDFACTTGNMHACGHDMHTAMLLGAARLLKNHESELKGTVKLMFQPAEEIFEGSQDMINAGVLESPHVNAALMIHVTAAVPFPSGTVIVSSPGISAPAADYFTIEIQGKGCHGSTPEQGIDSLTVAAHTLIALQELSARELAISDEAVLTIGTLNGGTAANVIADSAIMQGTIRTFDESVRSMLKKRIEEITNGIAMTFRAAAKVSFGSGCPTLINDQQISEFSESCTAELLGKKAVFTTAALSGVKPSRSGGSEDFAYISQKVPSVMLAMASGEPDKGYSYPQHHPKVKFDEAVLPIGSAVYAWNAIRWLESQSTSE